MLTYDFFGVKTVRNNDEPSEFWPTYNVYAIWRRAEQAAC